MNFWKLGRDSDFGEFCRKVFTRDPESRLLSLLCSAMLGYTVWSFSSALLWRLLFDICFGFITRHHDRRHGFPFQRVDGQIRLISYILHIIFF